jgi:hypothetical protein
VEKNDGCQIVVHRRPRNPLLLDNQKTDQTILTPRRNDATKTKSYRKTSRAGAQWMVGAMCFNHTAKALVSRNGATTPRTAINPETN